MSALFLPLKYSKCDYGDDTTAKLTRPSCSFLNINAYIYVSGTDIYVSSTETKIIEPSFSYRGSSSVSI